MTESGYKFYVTCPEDRPVFWSIPVFLWGEGCDVDTDGDSYPATSTTWTELYIVLRRASRNAKVDIFPLQNEPLILAVISPNSYLAVRAAYVLARYTKGKIAKPPSDMFVESDVYVGQLGEYFDLDEALQRFSDATT
jgi:hypothetical protein